MATILDALRRIGVQVPDTERPFQIRCPFHDDETPSARVYPATDSLHCFACHRSWDVAGVLRSAGLDYRDLAPRLLALDRLDRLLADLVLAIAVLPPDRRIRYLAELDEEVLVPVIRAEWTDEEIRRAIRVWQHRLLPGWRHPGGLAAVEAQEQVPAPAEQAVG